MNTEKQIASSKFYPPSYYPQPPKLKLYERLFGWFSTLGRARLRLTRACISPHPLPENRALIRSMNTLLDIGGTKTPEWLQTAYSILLYLAWAAIHSSTIENARRWLKKIDNIPVILPERMGLRWELMQILFEKRDDCAYFDEAKMLFSDPLLLADQHVDALTHTLTVLYENISPKHCEEVLLAAHKDLKRKNFFEAALSVCQCPASFMSKNDAECWTKRTKSDSLRFSQMMTADALIIRARAAEWFSKWEKMESLAEAAMKAATTHPMARYWLMRARLHQFKRPPLEGFSESALDNLPQKQRLILQIQLHQYPSFDTVQQILPVLNGEYGILDTQEKLLIVWLAEKALTSNEAREIGNLAKCVGLSTAIAKVAGMLPWVEINIALSEVQINRQYLRALQRLESKDILTIEPAKPLSQIIRILLGLPALPRESYEDDCIAVLNETLQRLVNQGTFLDVDGSVLLAKFKQINRNPLLKQFPALKVAAVLLHFALRAMIIGDVVGEELLTYAIPENAPTWAHWIFARLMVLGNVLVEDKSPLNLNKMPDLDHATIWFIDRWWLHVGRPWQTVPKTVESVRSMLPIEGNQRFLPMQGSIFEGVCRVEAQWLEVLADSRASLAKGQVGDALSKLSKGEKLLKNSGPIVYRVWRPLVRYWIGVAALHTGKEKGALVLEELLSGPMGAQARAQLALSALQKHDIDAACRWLTDMPLDFPAAFYTQALMHAKNNQTTEALIYLDELYHRLDGNPSPYNIASRRLRAAIAERSSDPAAEELLEDILHTWPSDCVTRARRERILLKRAYDVQGINCEFIAELKAGNQPTDIRPQHVPFTWGHQYQLLYRLLAYSKTSTVDTFTSLTQDIDKQIPKADQRIWWFVLLAVQLLRSGEPGNALKIIDNSYDFSVHPSVERSRSILRIWDELHCRTDWDPCADAVRKLEAQVLTLQSFGADDRTATLWRMLAQNAILLLKGQTVAPEQWGLLCDSPMSLIPFLFHHDNNLRRFAAAELLPAIDLNPSPWRAEPQTLLKALTAWALEKDDSFIEHYTAIEPVLAVLPIPANVLWTSAALIRFTKEDWRSLDGAHLPDCLADMSDPLVSLIVELADARATIVDLKNPSQAMVKRITRIQNNLTFLVEWLDLQQAEALS